MRSISKILFLLFCVVAFFSCGKSENKLEHTRVTGINIVSHRGFHFNKLAPENSLDAIYLASRVGYKAIELDLSLTLDKKAIVFHDDSLNATLSLKDGYLPLTEEGVIMCNAVNFEDVRNKYVFTSDNEAMRRRVATLEEALHLCKELGLYPYLELKTPNFEDEFDAAAEVVETANKILGKNNFAITSFDFTLIGFLRKKYPDLDLYCDTVNHLKGLVDHRLHYFPEWIALKQEFIDIQHQAGRQVATWTVLKDEFDIVSAKNVDAILSDEVAPNFDAGKAIYSNHSNTSFSEYATTGTLENNVLKLKKGEKLTLTKPILPSIYLGAIYFHIDAKGKFLIEATNFETTRENNMEDYKLYKFQYLIHNEVPSFSITAMEDGVIIKDLWFAVTDF